MSRILFGLCLAALSFVGLGGGCANFVETRTITRFAEALEDKDLATLKDASTETFAQKALRRDEALDDFGHLKLPEGKVEVVNVEDLNEDEKRVTVEVGEKKRRLQYRLVRSDGSRKWVVDDITVKQRKDDLLSAAKSVTEQMNLLLSVREFLAAWKTEDQDQITGVVTPEFAALLKRLPPKYLFELTHSVVAGKPGESDKAPEAQLDSEVAIVKLARSKGALTLTLKLIDGSWKVSDLAVESRADGKHIPSLSKMATVTALSLEFLDAYAASDRDKLIKVCTPKLYGRSLVHANLSAIPLPDSKAVSDKYEVTLDRGSTDFVIETDKEVIRISFQRLDSEELDKTTAYLVEEVTIYELDGTQNKRLSSAFTAQAIVQIFGESLATRNLSMLKRTSTTTFTERVWRHLDEVSLQDMPLSEFQSGPPNIVETAFLGAATEVTVDHGVHRMTYVLRDRLGDVRVDDILVGIPGRPFSLRETLEAVLPVSRYIQAVRASDLGMLQRTSSPEFNQLVWRQIDGVPPICELAVKHLQAPMTRVEGGDSNALVVFGDDRAGARVLLVKDHGQFVVDEIQLIAGPEAHQRAKLRDSIRFQMAEGRLRSVGGDNSTPHTTGNRPGESAIATAPQVLGPNDGASNGEPDAHAIQPADDAFTPPADEPSGNNAAASLPPTTLPQATSQLQRSAANAPAVTQ